MTNQTTDAGRLQEANRLLIECLETIIQLDTSPEPEHGQELNGLKPFGNGRLRTPRESAQFTLDQLKRMRVA